MFKRVFLHTIFATILIGGTAQTINKNGNIDITGVNKNRDKNVSNVVLNADRFEYKGDVIYAYDDVSMRYQDTLFFANKAVYNRKTNIIVLKGNVQIIESQGPKVIADSVVFKANNKNVRFSNFYTIDKDDIWIYAKSGEKKDKKIIVENSILSSCSVDKPDWKVGFKKAIYDSDTKYIELKDVQFYAEDTPILYTPYLGFSLNRERHSGFLMPVISYNPDDGLIYEQPYFWAISKSMDMEFRPQIRTGRGYGLYTTLRFVDTNHSKGTVRVGFFKDYESYQKEFSLENSEHYGVEFLYENSDFLGSLKPYGYSDELYINLNLFNDIDYINLQNRGLLSHLEETNRYKESRLNYFLYNDVQYFGLGVKYFIDTTKSDNGDTIQELPHLHYHKFSSPIVQDKIHYRVDSRFYNLYRENDPKAYRGLFSLPVTFQTALFQDYLNLAIEEEFQASDTHFTDEDIFKIKKNNHYASAVLHHKIELSSDVMKVYETGTHTMILSSALSKTTKLAEGDLKFEDINEDIVRDFDLDTVYDTQVKFKMRHFWESKKRDNLNVDYFVEGDFYPELDSKWNKLRQELTVNYKKFTVNSQLEYSIQYDHFTQFSNSLKYDGDRVKLGLSHRMRKDEVTKTLIENDVSFDASYKESDTLTWYGGYSYDIEDKLSKKWQSWFSL